MDAPACVKLTIDGSWTIGDYTTKSTVPVGIGLLPTGPSGRKSMFNGLADSIWTGSKHQNLGSSFLFGDGAGVFYCTHDGQAFVPQRLAPTAQTLAITQFDFTGNGQPGIVAGNDFQMPDQAWAALRTSGLARLHLPGRPRAP